jgi:hypothetical protein
MSYLVVPAHEPEKLEVFQDRTEKNLMFLFIKFQCYLPVHLLNINLVHVIFTLQMSSQLTRILQNYNDPGYNFKCTSTKKPSSVFLYITETP